MFWRHKTNPEEYISQNVRRFLPSDEYKIFLFWSRADGTADAYSDRDIGILGKQKVPFQVLLRIIWSFDDTPYRVDIVDFANKNDYFSQKALSNIKYI